MHRPSSAVALIASFWIALASTGAAESPVERARILLDRNDPRAAAGVLEDALIGADPDKLPPIIDGLRQAYEKAAAQATADGHAREAEGYRENLRLLNRKSRPAKAVETPAPAIPKEPASRAETSPGPEEKPVLPLEESAVAGPAEAPKSEAIQPDPEKLPEPPQDSTPNDLARADRAWKAKKYHDAGAIYGQLAREGKLPAARNDHWAYCRLVKVLEVINTGPNSPAQWAAVHAEIDRIRVLSPKNWYGEYLRSVAVERSGVARRPSSNKTILRGAQPDEKPASPAPQRKPRTSGNPGAMKRADPVPTPQPAANDEAAIGQPGTSAGPWQVFETANFRIFHRDEELARKVAAKAESSRTEFAAFWSGTRPRFQWAPRCELYLHPTAAQFHEDTKQPEESPGFSTCELNRGRVTQRVIHLRADHPKMHDAVLPHEVTHVVLADLFPIQQVPRWADEGMAVLSEPATEQSLRANDLASPLGRGNVFDMTTLMTTDYPTEPLRSMFYAQSISVTRYLVSLGTPQNFVAFVKDSQARGIEPALGKAYGIKGFAELDRRWRDYAQGQGTETAAAEALRK